MSLTVEDIFFQVTSNLTGGVVTDLGTVIAGGIVLLLILFVLDILKEFFEVTMMNFTAQKSFNAARNYRGLRDSSDSSSMEYEYYDALYNSHMKKSVGLSLNTGKDFYSEETVSHDRKFNIFYEGDDSEDDSREEIEFDG